MICPRCKCERDQLSNISKRDNKTAICNVCKADESVFDFFIYSKIEKEKRWLKGETLEDIITKNQRIIDAEKELMEDI